MTNVFLSKFPKDYFRLTTEYILSTQQPDGSIPWFEGGHIDTWDHTEAAMGLSIGGQYDSAERAYQWLRET